MRKGKQNAAGNTQSHPSVSFENGSSSNSGRVPASNIEDIYSQFQVGSIMDSSTGRMYGSTKSLPEGSRVGKKGNRNSFRNSLPVYMDSKVMQQMRYVYLRVFSVTHLNENVNFRIFSQFSCTCTLNVWCNVSACHIYHKRKA